MTMCYSAAIDGQGTAKQSRLRSEEALQRESKQSLEVSKRPG